MAKDSVGMKGRAGTQSGAAPKNRLDSRMQELETNLKDDSLQLVRTKSGKFQFVSRKSGGSKPAASKPTNKRIPFEPMVPKTNISNSVAMSKKPSTGAGAIPTPQRKINTSKELLDDYASASTPSAKALTEGYSGRRGTGLPPKEDKTAPVSTESSSKVDGSSPAPAAKPAAKFKATGRGVYTRLEDPSDKPKRLGRGLAAGGEVGHKDTKANVKKEAEMMRNPKKFSFKERNKMAGEEEKEAKGMKCGGMAKYGRGGGIERRGSGAGTVIKGYKNGGSIDGLSRVKTRGKVC